MKLLYVIFCLFKSNDKRWIYDFVFSGESLKLRVKVKTKDKTNLRDFLAYVEKLLGKNFKILKLHHPYTVLRNFGVNFAIRPLNSGFLFYKA